MTPGRPTQATHRSLALALLAIALLAALPGFAANPPATWTTGHKKVLVIPIRFTDQAGPSDTPNASGYRSGWGNMTNGVTAAALNDFFQRASYGKVSLEFTVLPEIDLGVSYTTYNAQYGTTGLTKFAAWDRPGSLGDDARTKARLAGIAAGQAARYDSDNYDLDIILGGFIPGQGTLASGRTFGKGIFGTTTLALAHELSHNFGLQHANGISRPTFHSPLRTGSFFTDTYGDPFDLMGWKNTSPIPLPADRDPSPFWKNLLGWLPDANVATLTTSGTYRVHAFDQPTMETGKNYALRIVRDPSRVYWLSYRQSITNTEAIWSANGLEVRLGGELIPATAGHTTLLDMTPGSRGLPNSPGVTNNPYATMYDAPLAIGRTYSDAEANLHVTPVKKGGTAPESLDVVVNFGPFPGNVPPTAAISPATVSVAAGVAQTLSVNAADANGDALSYYWEFDDPDAPGGAAAGNVNPDAHLAMQGSHIWMRAGTYIARCTVTDMKGGKTIASASVTVTGGSAALLTISGTVKDELGNPLAGAVVNNYKGANPNLVRYGATNFVGASETAADGKFVVHVPAGLTGTFYLNAVHQGYTFTCSFAGGAVTVSSSSVANVNFTRVRTNRTVSGGIYVAGRGYDPVTDGPLTVTANGQNIAAGAGSWSTTVPDGTPFNVTATPANGAYTVTSFFPNPYVAVDDFNLLHLFVSIPGRMPAVSFTSAGAASDDTVGTVNIPVTLTLPAGSNSWPANQAVYYTLDPSSTAEYGVDYLATGGDLTFYGGQTPAPQTIPLKLLPTGQPKSKTVVFRLLPATSIVNLGAQTTFTYTITNPPPTPLQITAQPVAVTTSVTSNVTFSVAATGTAPLTFQWRKDGSALGGPNSSTLTLNNVQTNQAGGYSVVVADASGSVTSSVVALVVNRLAQTITFGSLPAKQTSDAPFALTATASSGQPVSYTSSDTAVATVSGTIVTIVGAGTTTLTASQPGNAAYLAATSVAQALTVTAAPPSGGTVYDVGPGRARTLLREVPWASLQPGDIVNIHYKPGGYKEKFQISASGTAGARIVIRGIPDPNTGALPIIDGNGAVEDPAFDPRHSKFTEWSLILVSPRNTGYVYGTTHVEFVDIETLDLRNATYSGDGSVTYTDKSGATRGYGAFCAGIYIEWARDFAVRGCEISNCGIGVFANSKNGAAQSSARLLIERNYFHDNSNPYIADPANPGGVPLSNGFGEHHCYTESVGIIYQYNRFGRHRPGARGVAIKDRSSGQVIRYNEFDMTEQSNVLIDAQPDYRDSYVYGNLITVQPYAGSMSMIFWGAFNSPNSYAQQHRGTLHFYHNTVVSHHEGMALFHLPDSLYTGATNRTFESVDCRNNIFFTDTALQNNIYDAMYFSTAGSNHLGGGDIVLGKNWISPNWRKESPGHPWTGQLLGTANLIVGDSAGANNPGFADIARKNYYLLGSANAIDAAGPLAPAVLPANDVTQQFDWIQNQFFPRQVLGNAAELGAIEAVPSFGQFRFSAPDYSTYLALGSVAVTVERVNGTNGTVAVDFLTRPGTAQPSEHYTPAFQVLTWSAGDAAPKSVTINLNPNGMLASNKTFTVSLTNAVGGALLGAPVTATININSIPPPPLPTHRPLARPQGLTLIKNVPELVTLTGYDVDGDPLTYIVTTQPRKGTLTGTPPNLTYTPSNNVTGADSFNFVVSDGQFNSAPAVVALWINEASNSLPSVSLISPANNSWVVAPTNLTIEVNGSDTDGIYAVELFEGTNGLTALLTPPFTYTWNVRTQGVYHLFARAIDPLNNRRFSDPVTIRALGAMPKISIRPATNGPLQVAWPLSVGGAVLEESTNLVSWTLVTNTLVDTATERTHTVAPTQRRYFRFSVW
jgi:hypothetical protein